MPGVVHLRIVVPPDRTARALTVLTATGSVCNVIHLAAAARRPDGDVVLCDVAREDASVVVADLRGLGIDRDGSITIDEIDTQISAAAARAERSARGATSDAVVWEEVEARTSESTELSGSFVAFIVLACLLGAAGVYLDNSILIIGAMVVGPEFGPLAGLCVALVQRRRPLAARSFLALAVGFPAGITAAWLITHAFRATGVFGEHFDAGGHVLSSFIADPDFLSVFVAFCAGVVGMLSLTAAKSGALIGVLISVTTIPSAANIGLAAAYGDWATWRGSMAQLGVNLASIVVAGTLTLAVQRAIYARREARHRDEVEAVTGTPTPRASSAPARSPRRRTPT